MSHLALHNVGRLTTDHLPREQMDGVAMCRHSHDRFLLRQRPEHKLPSGLPNHLTIHGDRLLTSAHLSRVLTTGLRLLFPGHWSSLPFLRVPLWFSLLVLGVHGDGDWAAHVLHLDQPRLARDRVHLHVSLLPQVLDTLHLDDPPRLCLAGGCLLRGCLPLPPQSLNLLKVGVDGLFVPTGRLQRHWWGVHRLLLLLLLLLLALP